MFVRRRLINCIINRSKSTSERFRLKLNEDVESGLKDGRSKARKHPGLYGVAAVELPRPLTHAAVTTLKGFPEKNLVRDGKKFARYLWSRHAPAERDEVKAKYIDTLERVKAEAEVDPDSPYLDEKTKERIKDSIISKAHNKFKTNLYNWKAIEYDDYSCALYLTSRLAGDFASLYRILGEIKQRHSSFSPQTMLDFGSGVGSAIWAVDAIWPKMCQESVCVDSSSEMNDMADRLLRGGDANTARAREGGTFFKQFLPMSSELKYDLVIASRSLFELPDIEARLRVIDILWRKTGGYLVIVEAGTNAGYKLVQEARDYVLELRRENEEGQGEMEAHVFSPCPHDLFCPRFFDGTNTPCNFEVSYKPFQFGKDAAPTKDIFSYVVLKRGQRQLIEGKENQNEISTTDNQWPRVIRAPLHRTKHVICRTCTKYGKLQEYVVTKRRHGKECYRVAKNTKWGDLLPIQTEEPQNGESLGSDVDQVQTESSVNM